MALSLSIHAERPTQMPLYFHRWIDEDVPYIITQDERREFLHLRTDDEREKFIEQFWESRNPSPHSSINTFKEEHYRRLAYVRANFGDSRYNDGWRTDMGRVYITLGAPQQRSNFHQGISTRPVEIWFYYSPTPALPPTFNLVFYKPSESEEYILYSPRSDGPTKIVTNDAHDDSQALHTIDQSMGAEATHAMVSLLPTEPIDVVHPSPTMQSDLLLEAVRNLPEQKLEKERIARQRASGREVVTSSLLTGFNPTEIQSVVLHDEHGLSTVHYMVRHVQPDASVIGTLPGKRTGYQVTLLTRVATANGKAIYERREKLVGEVSPEAAKTGKTKLFAAEGRLPLVPGTYSVESFLNNEITHESSRAVATVTVPSPEPDALSISDLMVYTGRPLQTPREQLPFTVGGLRFAPRGQRQVELHTGEGLPFTYQIWLPKNELASLKATSGGKQQMIHVHYALGLVASSGGPARRVEDDEELPMKDSDDAGNVLSGHTIDTTNLQQGTYRLVVRVNVPGLAQSASSTMTVKIVPDQVPVGMWTAFSDERQHPGWQDDLLRGLAAEALNNKAEAATFYRRVLAAKPDSVDARDHLNQLDRATTVRTSGL